MALAIIKNLMFVIFHQLQSAEASIFAAPSPAPSGHPLPQVGEGKILKTVAGAPRALTILASIKHPVSRI